MLAVNDDILFQALIDRDPRFDGRAYAGVRTTGIFCRLTCPAPKPKRQNVSFFENAGAAMAAGFRACKRCRPLKAAGSEPLVDDLLGRLDAEPGRIWREGDLKALGYDPSTVRRAFQRQLGCTFLGFARSQRLGRAAAGLGKSAVIEAQLDAGFSSASGFRAAMAKLLGRPPASLQKPSGLKAGFVTTPLGPMVLAVHGGDLVLLEFIDRKNMAGALAFIEEKTGEAISVSDDPSLSAAKHAVASYFDGETKMIDLAFRWFGTDFTQDVWRALRSVPPGETRSYAELAAMVGRPKAMRAVARANASNHLAIVVPCHRVIGSDGKLMGYAGGAWRKAWLLEHERSAG
jgi:AraC family transcriptional regulator of adaptative response/methylated-DNA-[protein]-cysteine methyltransferase